MSHHHPYLNGSLQTTPSLIPRPCQRSRCSVNGGQFFPRRVLLPLQQQQHDQQQGVGGDGSTAAVVHHYVIDKTVARHGDTTLLLCIPMVVGDMSSSMEPVMIKATPRRPQAADSALPSNDEPTTTTYILLDCLEDDNFTYWVLPYLADSSIIIAPAPATTIPDSSLHRACRQDDNSSSSKASCTTITPCPRRRRPSLASSNPSRAMQAIAASVCRSPTTNTPPLPLPVVHRPLPPSSSSSPPQETPPPCRQLHSPLYLLSPVLECIGLPPLVAFSPAFGDVPSLVSRSPFMK